MPPLPKGGVFEIEEIISSKRPTTTTVSNLIYMYMYVCTYVYHIISAYMYLNCHVTFISDSVGVARQ